MLTATFLSYGKARNSTPHRIKTPDPIEIELGTVDYVGEETRHAKFYTNPPSGGSRQMGEIYAPIFSRAKAECFARLCHHLGVRLSVTLVSCIKTVQAKITKFLLWAAPTSLVYRDKISCHWVQKFPSNEGVKKVYPLKRRHFVLIGSNNVKTVADRYIHACLLYTSPSPRD